MTRHVAAIGVWVICASACGSNSGTVPAPVLQPPSSVNTTTASTSSDPATNAGQGAAATGAGTASPSGQALPATGGTVATAGSPTTTAGAVDASPVIGAGPMAAGQTDAGQTAAGQTQPGSMEVTDSTEMADAGQATGTDAGTATEPTDAMVSAQADAGAPAADAEVEPDTSEPVALAPDQPLIPAASWDCGMPEGIPGPASGELIFELELPVDAVRDVGETPYGYREQINFGEGTVDGPAGSGSVLPYGFEHVLRLDNDVYEFEQLHFLQLGEEQVYMRACGVAPNAETNARMVLDFEALIGGDFEFLHDSQFIAEREYEPGSRQQKLKVYAITSAADTDAPEPMRIEKPTDRPSQSWTCATEVIPQTTEIFQLVAELGPTYSVGESKRGLRTAIPITGGPVTGGITGKVLPGGADYQLLAELKLDARYALQTDDDEFILVRNCGSFGSMVPTFETRVEGPYNYLNKGPYRSADPVPSLTIDSVTIVYYK